MKKNYFGLMLFVLVLIIGCKNSKDMSLYVNDNLNDSEHIGNLKIKKQKEEVLKSIIEFDNWYRENSGKIEYRYSSDIWNMGFEYGVDDNIRIPYLKDSIVPRIPACKQITNALKNKAEENAQSDDPGNVGVILTGSKYGCNLINFTFLKNKKEYNWFHDYWFLNTDNGYGDDIDAPAFRTISYEEAKFYHLSFIKIIDDTHAIYRAIINLTNGEPAGHQGFLVLNMLKQDDSWLVDDISYIEEEELIEGETGYNLVDYPSNKEAYETGIK